MDYRSDIPEAICVGKVVIDKHNETHVLRGNMHENEWAQARYDLYKEEKIGKEEIRKSLRSLIWADWVGFHKDIPTKGIVLGGGILLVFPEKGYHLPGSTDFGSASTDQVDKCLDISITEVR
jgi:hypothetical protein